MFRLYHGVVAIQLQKGGRIKERKSMLATIIIVAEIALGVCIFCALAFVGLLKYDEANYPAESEDKDVGENDSPSS